MWRRGRGWLKTALQDLPRDPMAAMDWALTEVGIDDSGRAPYLTAVLMSINGWAAWCAHERWQRRLAGDTLVEDDELVELLAIRVVWEALLKADAPSRSLPPDWTDAWKRPHIDHAIETSMRQQATGWLLLRALEFAFQDNLARGLLQATSKAAETASHKARAQAAIAAQAVFCIDVRSEVFRRALEASSHRVQTRGFAGFFGLPIAFSPSGTRLCQPQLPALLAPAKSISDEPGEAHLAQALRARRQAALSRQSTWADFRGAATSAFTFVETLGAWYGIQLMSDSLNSGAPPKRWQDGGLSASQAQGLRPHWPVADGDVPAVAGMLRGVLQAMGLVRDFAPLVLLAGHGSQTANNAHAAGLDCGACGGQTGEVNARVLAGLLNDPRLRAALIPLGIIIPAETHVVAGLHNTTTDELTLFDADTVPASHISRLSELQHWLADAGQRARAERAPGLGLKDVADQPEVLRKTLHQRANDWSEVRPEWGLANNAAFIVAPRQRSQHLDLAGRCFLHDYDAALDADGSVLELIMTAPMVVTHWINAQYHASSVDPLRFGSGDKVLHNVVGGHIGVFEGNGGDLRIGLPLQSLHDGERLRHAPLRLSVFIEASQAAIDDVLRRHESVRHLVDHGWLHLFRLQSDDSRIEQRMNGRWVSFAEAASSATTVR